MKRYGNYIFFACCILGLALYSMFGGGSTKTVLNFGDDSLAINYSDFESAIPYSDIQTVELVETEDFGAALNGSSNNKYRWGTWENGVWGVYTQCTSMFTDYCVVLTLKDESVFVLSYQDEKTTIELGEMIPGYLTAHGYSIQVIENTNV